VPFTISHAAAVLPLNKTRLPLAALMIGSMSPDFAYFLPGEPLRELTHSLAGIFWFCWPVSFGLWLLFVRVLEEPTRALLPDRWHFRFVLSDRDLSLKTFALASAAVVLGAATHIFWDSFTHRGTAVVDALPGLHAVAFHVHGWGIRWFMVLQHLSSVLGLLALLIWAWKLPPIHRIPRTLPPASHATRIRAVAFLVASSLGLAITSYALNSQTWFMRRLFHFAIGGMTGWVIAWFAIAIFVTRIAGRPLTAPIPRE
jgi:Domain of unknown function (DUF4184)